MQQLKLKLLEIGKTKANNSSLDIFNFYVVLAGCDPAGLPRAGKNSKPHHYKNVPKIEGPSENMWFNGKTVWRFQTKKKNRNIILDLSKNPSGIQGLWARQLNKALVKSKK